MEKLIIFQKSYEFLLWICGIVNRIPKSHRWVFGRNLEEIGVLMLMTIIKANKKTGQERSDLQEKISEDLDCLRILTRLIKDLKFISIRQYLFGSEKLNEIGRMLNAWMKVNKG